MTVTAIAKLTDAFTETEIDDEVVVMRLDSGEFFSMTGTGRHIWRMIDGARDRDSIVADLSESFAGEPVGIAADVDAFLARLRDAGLVSP